MGKRCRWWRPDGAIRLPNSQAKGDVESSRYRIGNLFDPFQPLLDLQAWLVDRPAAAFISAAQALKVLVPVGADAAFRKTPSKPPTIVVTTGTSRNGIALESLSDGYRSVLAMAAHLMSLIEGRWDRTEDAEGIVLIDELENHLHPRWRMRILWALRGAFPRIQFVVSTHDPLCLRSARSGEVVVLHRVGADIAAAT